MEELKRFLVFFTILILILSGIVLRHKFGHWFVSFRDECSFIPYKNGKKLCLGSDAGVKSNYTEAEIYCNKMNMRLPTRDEVWYIWIASENCNRIFASEGYVSKNIYDFKNPESEKVQAFTVKNYCNQSSSIKFAQSLQYKDGYFWLGDFAGGKRHYAINYSNGNIKIFKDKTPSLGVRCVK